LLRRVSGFDPVLQLRIMQVIGHINGSGPAAGAGQQVALGRINAEERHLFASGHHSGSRSACWSRFFGVRATAVPPKPTPSPLSRREPGLPHRRPNATAGKQHHLTVTAANAA
jgi:hypothetical protein